VSLYVPGAIGLFLVADPAVTLVFGADYADAVPIVQVLTAFVVLKAVNDITNQTLDYLGVARIRAYAKVLGAGANVALNVALIPVYGAPGAAIATVATYGILVGVNLVLLTRTIPVSVHSFARTALQAAFIGAAVGGAVLVALPHVAGYLTLAGIVLLGVVVWGVLAVVSGLLDPDQIAAALAS
jgi:O-antigen/teichoic acid export membrane protein